jgi:hypothetical protein
MSPKGTVRRGDDSFAPTVHFPPLFLGDPGPWYTAAAEQSVYRTWQAPGIGRSATCKGLFRLSRLLDRAQLRWTTFISEKLDLA